MGFLNSWTAIIFTFISANASAQTCIETFEMLKPGLVVSSKGSLEFEKGKYLLLRITPQENGAHLVEYRHDPGPPTSDNLRRWLRGFKQSEIQVANEEGLAALGLTPVGQYDLGQWEPHGYVKPLVEVPLAIGALIAESPTKRFVIVDSFFNDKDGSQQLKVLSLAEDDGGEIRTRSLEELSRKKVIGRAVIQRRTEYSTDSLGNSTARHSYEILSMKADYPGVKTPTRELAMGDAIIVPTLSLHTFLVEAVEDNLIHLKLILNWPFEPVDEEYKERHFGFVRRAIISSRDYPSVRLIGRAALNRELLQFTAVNE